MRVAMLAASDEATAGSVMQNADRIWPSSNGFSQLSCCAGEPNIASTSMLPLCGAVPRLRRKMRAAAAAPRQQGVMKVGQPRAEPSVGQEEVPQPEAARLAL